MGDPIRVRHSFGPTAPHVVRPTIERDLGWVKVMADRHRAELGFVRLPALAEAQRRGELSVLVQGGGFVCWHRRRDGWATIYEIVSEVPGGGRALLESLSRPLRLKCPEGLAANGFYEHMGALLARTEPGKKRALNVWEWPAQF